MMYWLRRAFQLHTGAAASDVKRAVSENEITKCPICLDDCKNPKSLPCLHSFCSHCLQQHWKDKCFGDEVPCPVCREQLEIPDEGLDELPHNFFVQHLIEAKTSSNEQPGEACKKDGEQTECKIPPPTM